jgi:hypothetical protein
MSLAAPIPKESQTAENKSEATEANNALTNADASMQENPLGSIRSAVRTNSNESNFGTNANNSRAALATTSQPYHTYHQVKREPSHRVFVNRSLQLSKINFFGFDMVCKNKNKRIRNRYRYKLFTINFLYAHI